MNPAILCKSVHEIDVLSDSSRSIHLRHASQGQMNIKGYTYLSLSLSLYIYTYDITIG